MKLPKGALRLAIPVGFLVLGACSSGGGGAAGLLANNTPPASNTSAPANSTPPANNTPVSQIEVSPPGTAVEITSPPGMTVAGQVPEVDTMGTTPNFLSSPPSSTLGFPLFQAVLSIHPPPLPGVEPIGGGTVVYFQGTTVENGVTYPVITLDIVSPSVHATNLVGDGVAAVQSDGSKVAFAADAMTYTALGVWAYTPADPTAWSYLGVGTAGFEGGMPTTGTAQYVGAHGAQGTSSAGGVAGVVFAPSGTGTMVTGTISGDITLSLDFLGSKFSGQTTNMTVTHGATTTAWNEMSLTGGLGGGASDVHGTTAVSSVPGSADAYSLSTAATGTFQGKFYGPNAAEIGGVWSLYENTSGGGKIAEGVIGATKQ